MKPLIFALLSLLAVPSWAQLQTWQLITAPLPAGCNSDPTQYGAVAGDATDDAAAFQSAINALPTSGGVVCVPAGRFIINTALGDALGTKFNITIRGAGSSGWGSAADNPGVTRLVTTAGNKIIDFGPNAGNGSTPGGVQIEDISFVDETASKNATGAMDIKRHQHVRLNRVSCADFTQGYCVHFDGTTGALDAVQYGLITDMHARNTKIGIQADGGSMQFVVLGGHFVAPAAPNYEGSKGIYLNAGTAGRADTWRILNPSLESYKIGIHLVGTLGVNVQARVENTSGASYHDATCIKIEGTATFTANYNTVTASSLNGCATGIDIGTLVTNTQMTDNAIVDVTNKINCDASVTLDNMISGADLVNAGAGTGCVRRSWSQAFPSSSCVQGSTHQRTSGTGTGFYVCQNSAWVGK